MQVLASAGCVNGYFTRKLCRRKDRTRILNMNRKSDQPTMTQRKKLHAKRKGLLDTDTEKEGLVYGAGEF